MVHFSYWGCKKAFSLLPVDWNQVRGGRWYRWIFGAERAEKRRGYVFRWLIPRELGPSLAISENRNGLRCLIVNETLLSTTLVWAFWMKFFVPSRLNMAWCGCWYRCQCRWWTFFRWSMSDSRFVHWGEETSGQSIHDVMNLEFHTRIACYESFKSFKLWRSMIENNVAPDNLNSRSPQSIRWRSIKLFVFRLRGSEKRPPNVRDPSRRTYATYVRGRGKNIFSIQINQRVSLGKSQRCPLHTVHLHREHS